MKYEISKELFEAVTFEVDYFELNGSVIYYHYWGRKESITINDFFFKCKEWASKQGYYLYSTTNDSQSISRVVKKYDNDTVKILYANSEQQAVFDACQWILDNKE